MSRRAIGLLVVVLLVVSLAPVIGATGTNEFALQVTPSVDVPDRTTTFEGTEYNVATIGRVSPGNDIGVAVTAPADTTYNVHLYNADKQIVDSMRRTGAASITFATAGLSPGSYTIALERDGQFETIHPVVISGYRVDIDAPDAVTTPGEVVVTVSLTTLGGGSIDRVDAVIADADDETSVTLDATSGQTYEGSISTSLLSEGTYRLYAVVRGTGTVDGTKELIGASDAKDLRVDTEPTTTATSTSDDNGGASGGSAGSETTTMATTTSDGSSRANTTTTTATSGTSTRSTTADPGSGTDGDVSKTSTATSQRTTSGRTSSDDVIAPNVNSTASNTRTTATAGLPFGVFRAAVVGVFCLFIGRTTRR